MILCMLPFFLSTLRSIATAQVTSDLATFTPLEDATTGVSTATSSSPTSLPSACIDACFNNATGSGKETGCVGCVAFPARLGTHLETPGLWLTSDSISGQYECICTFPAMLQTFQSCMSASCALDNTSIQETLGNVEQICASCNSDGCNTFSISAGGTVTFSGTLGAAQPSASLCYSTTQTVWTSSAGGFGGTEGGGSFSAGPVPCASQVAPVSPSPSASGTPLSDATRASPSSSGTPTSSSAAYGQARSRSMRSWACVSYLALSISLDTLV
ncbi:hypothetical protein B0H11DRAFT_2112775 [Mycena galericulata]|nr:hypothetical protein B0H11DRAFT_2112775 [Mycena galericulata]